MIENKLTRTTAGDFLLRKLHFVSDDKNFGASKEISNRGVYCPFSLPMITTIEKKGVDQEKKPMTQSDTYNQPNPCGSWCPHFNLAENGESVKLTCGHSVEKIKISNPEIIKEEPTKDDENKSKKSLKVSKK